MVRRRHQMHNRFGDCSVSGDLAGVRAVLALGMGLRLPFVPKASRQPANSSFLHPNSVERAKAIISVVQALSRASMMWSMALNRLLRPGACVQQETSQNIDLEQL